MNKEREKDARCTAVSTHIATVLPTHWCTKCAGHSCSGWNFGRYFVHPNNHCGKGPGGQAPPRRSPSTVAAVAAKQGDVCPMNVGQTLSVTCIPTRFNAYVDVARAHTVVPYITAWSLHNSRAGGTSSLADRFEDMEMWRSRSSKLRKGGTRTAATHCVYKSRGTGGQNKKQAREPWERLSGVPGRNYI